MKQYFLHTSKDNSDLELFEYSDGDLLRSSTIELDELQNIIQANSIVNFFLPSNQCITFNASKNKSESDEQFKARFLAENEHELIDDISNYLFVNSNAFSLVNLVEKKLIEPINNKLNQLGCDIRIFPEHFLLYAHSEDACIEFSDRFIFSFSDGSGFSVNKINLESYLNVIKQQDPDHNPKIIGNSKDLLKAFPESSCEKNMGLNNLHDHFINNKNSKLPNIFQRKLSMKSIYKRFELSSSQLVFLMILALGIISLPIINLSIMDYQEKEYRQKINQTFKSLSPNMRRVINPKAQMDELLINKAPVTNNFELNGLNYLKALDIEGISRSSIDFEEATIELEFNDIGQIKYSLIERLIEEFRLSIVKNEIVVLDSKVSGILKLEYPNE